MDLKIRVFLLLTVWVIAASNVEGLKGCDWPRGTCTYIHDPCPPYWERCAQYDSSCPLATNHCCCRKHIPGTTTPPPSTLPPTTQPTPSPKPKNVCDWPRGTCTYIYDPCPPDWHRCPQYDTGCTVATNHCCCRDRVPARDIVNAVRDPAAEMVCDWTKERTCWYRYDKTTCPEGFTRCRQYDGGCENPANWCCCLKA
ncbi:nidogen-2-like [Montipora capricornis]|uniref:nidogen-2-like n=1 Tax=Montipora capricornis TaxID=246305 RepID=UPI0035F21BC9